MHILLLGVFPEKDIKPDLNRFITDMDYSSMGIDYTMPYNNTLKSVLDMNNIPNNLPDTKCCRVKDLPDIDDKFVTLFPGYVYNGYIDYIFNYSIPYTLSDTVKDEVYKAKVKEVDKGIRKMLKEVYASDIVFLVDAHI